MRASTSSAVPAEVERVRQRIERWRQERRSGTWTPQKLWAGAATAAQRHGVYRKTRTLGLECNKLKSMAHRPDEAPARSEVARFVERMAPAGGLHAGRVLASPDGQPSRIQLAAR